MPSKSTVAVITDDSSKFELYLKTREIKQIYKTLRKIMLMPKLEREAWLDEHGSVVAQGFDNFIDSSNVALDNLSLDTETLELSRDLVLHLRDSLTMVHGFLLEEPELES